MLTLLLTFLLSSDASAASKTERAAVLAGQAWDAKEAGDMLKAYKLAMKALKLDPNNVEALFVRGILLISAANQSTDPNARSSMMKVALHDMSMVAQLAPDSVPGGIARDVLKQSASPFPTERAPEVSCPPSAQASLDEAERAFSAGKMDVARPAYEKALAECPENADWWVYYGDVFFTAHNYAGARQQYAKALAIAPCHWMAHRFMGDAYLHEGKMQESYESTLRSVACNPDYSAGRESLKAVVNDQIALVRNAAANAMGTTPGHHWDMAPSRAQQSQSGPVWAVVVEARKEAGASPMETEKKAVLAGLALWRQMNSNDSFWSTMSRAESNGLLEPAIYMLLMDESLAPEFSKWRVEHLADLVKFIGNFLEVAPALEAR